MDIFISWSGDKSRAVAETLYKFLPMMIQSVRPFMSRHSIEPGTRPLNRLATELEATSLGIICLTRSNLAAPWIMYEAGALSKNLTKARVWTYLVDVTYADVPMPLGQFQHVLADDVGTHRLFESINRSLETDALAPEVFNGVYERFSGPLNKELAESKAHEESALPAVADKADKTDEILTTLRSLSQRVELLSLKTKKERPVRLEEDIPIVRGRVVEYQAIDQARHVPRKYPALEELGEAPRLNEKDGLSA